MKYTKDNLHGIVYNHMSGSPKNKRIIRLNIPTSHYNHTTCNNKTGISETPWFTDDDAIRWLETGVWILQEQPTEIINNYSIF